MIACATRIMVLVPAWLLLSESVSWGNIATGFLFAAMLLFVTPPGRTGRRAMRPLRYLQLIGRFVRDTITGTAQLARAAVRRNPMKTLDPSIVGLPLELRRDAPLMMMANFITLTPGTLSIHISEDRETLYVHSLLEADVRRLVPELKSGYEKPLLDLYPDGRERE